jgi:hypothetical protein
MVDVCPVSVEAVTDAAQLSAVQAVVTRKGLRVVSARNEFNDVAVVEVILPAEVDRTDPMGLPKYVGLMDQLRQAGASFEGTPKLVASPACQVERGLNLSLRPTGYVFVFSSGDGQRMIAAAEQLSIPVTTYVGQDSVAVRVNFGQPTGSLMFRVKRGDFGMIREAGTLLPGATILDRVARIAPAGK